MRRPFWAALDGAGPLRVAKWLYVLLGLAPTVLSVTGTIIWYRRWRRTPVEPTTGDAGPVGTRSAELPPRLGAEAPSEAAPADR